MPDITMCDGRYCPLKEDCTRFKAKPSSYQSFFSESPYDIKKESCEYFWKLEEPKEDSDV